MDGELAPEKVLEVEQHLEECRHCVEHLKLGHALRGSVRRVVEKRSQRSSALMVQVQLAIDAARQRDLKARRRLDAERDRALSWRTILPVAAAAAVTLVWAANTNSERAELAQQTASKPAPKQAEARMDPASGEELLEELVEHHVQNRPEFTEPALLPQVESEVGVPVKIPNLRHYGARWEGGSVVPVSNQQAASLRYKLAGHRVTVYVYDPSRVPIEQRLQQRLVGDEPVYIGHRRGYSIGATEHRGIGYAMATDLNDDETAELVAAIY